MNARRNLLIAGIFLLATFPALADVIVLNFENIAPYPNSSSTNPVAIENYYNGGTSSIGTSGTNYGVYFNSNALVVCLNTAGVVCSDTSRGGLGDPNSQEGGLLTYAGDQIVVNDPAGFTNGFSFFYTTAVTSGQSANIYSGLDGTGTMLGTISLGSTPWDGCGPPYNQTSVYCPFVPIGVSFTGTAESVVINEYDNTIVFDDLTLGSATPDPAPTPEPSSLAMLLAAVIAGSACLRKKLRLFGKVSV